MPLNSFPDFSEDKALSHPELDFQFSEDQISSPTLKGQNSKKSPFSKSPDHKISQFHSKSTKTITKKHTKDLATTNQTQSAQEWQKLEKEKSHDRSPQKKVSFIIKLLVIILILTVIGGLVLFKLEENLMRKPETDEFRRDVKNKLNNIYSQALNFEKLKAEQHESNQKSNLKVTVETVHIQTQMRQKAEPWKEGEVGNLDEHKNIITNQNKQNQKSDVQIKINAEKDKLSSNQNQNAITKLNKNDVSQNNLVAKNNQNTHQNNSGSKNFINQNYLPNSQSVKVQQHLSGTQNNAQKNTNDEGKAKMFGAVQIADSSPADTKNWKKPNQIEPTDIPQKIQQAMTDPSVPVMSCQDYIHIKQRNFGRLYTFTPSRKQFRSNSGADFYADNPALGINRVKYSEAVDMIDLIHQVNYKGEIEVEENPCEKKEDSVNRIHEIIKNNTERLNNLYQIDYYHSKQLRFCIVANSYNNAQSGLIYRNIDSILQQNYTNYHVVYTDDASPDRTGEVVKDYLKSKGVEEGKFKIKIKSDKKGMMENIYNAVTYDCESGEIVVMLDGDDSFIGTHVLSFLNAVYQRERLAIMWNNFLEVVDNSKVIMGFSRGYFKGEQIINYQRANRFVSSHLKSFFVDLFRSVKTQDLKDEVGNFYGGASDTAMMLPMIEMAEPKYMYVPEIVYEYRFDTGQVGMVTNRVEQKKALGKISRTPPYQPLGDFSFVDKAIQKAQRSAEKSSN